MDFRETITIALNSIRSNKLRSTLTLLGIVVGVFSIIGVMTAVRVLQNSIESGMSGLGVHTFQIQKMPMLFNASRSQWQKFRNRKDIKLEQAEQLVEKMTTAKYIAIEVTDGGKVVQSGSLKTNPNVGVWGEMPDGLPTNNMTVVEGRGLSDDDYRFARNVAVLGTEVVKKLFPYGNPVGSEIKVESDRYRVVGTFERPGGSFGGSTDNIVVIPLTAYMNAYGKYPHDLHIMIKSKSAEVYDDCVEEARLILRSARKVEPGEDDDFAVFSNDSMIQQFNDLTFYVKLGIGFISFISLLAAGVGIMNIMLVSVTERTKEIGIRKAIGARKSAILTQFVTEAVVLCQIGGIAGIALGILGGNLTALMFSFPAIIPVDWALIGFALCAFIGIVFGVYPAWKASNLDPIEALRFE